MNLSNSQLTTLNKLLKFFYDASEDDQVEFYYVKKKFHITLEGYEIETIGLPTNDSPNIYIVYKDGVDSQISFNRLTQVEISELTQINWK
jgi:hypothetical protein